MVFVWVGGWVGGWVGKGRGDVPERAVEELEGTPGGVDRGGVVGSDVGGCVGRGGWVGGSLTDRFMGKWVENLE